MTRVHDHDADREVQHRDDTDTVVADDTYDKFGGANVGAGIYGWLVATATAVLLTSVVGAVAAAIGDSQNITQSDAERQAGTVGLVSALVLLAVLLIGYYAGGYVAGRMSRFDGGRQGVLVWAIGVLVTALAVALGWAFGAKYNLLDRVNLPRIPIPHDQLTWGGVVAGIAVLVGTLLAAVAGGKVGRHYHDRVDRYADR
jgi:hypothetical protein